MTIDNIFKRFLKEEGIYTKDFIKLYNRTELFKESYHHVENLFKLYYPWQRIIRAEKSYIKRNELRRKYGGIDKKWKHRASNIFFQHNIDVGDEIVINDGDEGKVIYISPYGVTFGNDTVKRSCSFKRIIGIKGKNLFTNIYYKFNRVTYGKVDGDYHVTLLKFY